LLLKNLFLLSQGSRELKVILEFLYISGFNKDHSRLPALSKDALLMALELYACCGILFAGVRAVLSRRKLNVLQVSLGATRVVHRP
jgi:hypothetical protein